MSKEERSRSLTVWQGMLDLLVLRVLLAGPQHGHAISRRLAELSEAWLAVEEGSLYPCLYRMEKKGWISSEAGRSENNRKARFYTISQEGLQQLDAEEENWRQLQRAVNRVLRNA